MAFHNEKILAFEKSCMWSISSLSKRMFNFFTYRNRILAYFQTNDTLSLRIILYSYFTFFGYIKKFSLNVTSVYLSKSLLCETPRISKQMSRFYAYFNAYCYVPFVYISASDSSSSKFYFIHFFYIYHSRKISLKVTCI